MILQGWNHTADKVEIPQLQYVPYMGPGQNLVYNKRMTWAYSKVWEFTNHMIFEAKITRKT